MGIRTNLHGLCGGRLCVWISINMNELLQIESLHIKPVHIKPVWVREDMTPEERTQVRENNERFNLLFRRSCLIAELTEVNARLTALGVNVK